MNETALQSYVIKVVRANGGAARKLSHRFNLGVSDLLIKLKDEGHTGLRTIPAMLIEVKQRHGNNEDRVRSFDLGVTRPQREFLKEFAAAGMRVGVLSFIQPLRKRELYAALFDLDRLERVDYRALPSDHTALGRDQQRNGNIYIRLRNFANG